ncbi:efflux RND transporter permease subunit [Natrialba sp. SSL1]|uniref:efflux RND transporter permease subunit n=1 Tax=Natrialba sp. SSL1 TaxID=1869245 RepID=UPI0008F8EFF4|nr:MMPL family transporter [Natrialba sp. SSL1]OIB58023.1 RND transporter [Natrialba sp. SSL1]
MSETLSNRYADAVISYRRWIIVFVLLLTAVVAAGIVLGDDPVDDDGAQFDVDSPETAALEEIEETYAADTQPLTQVVVRDDGGDVLTRESLLEGLRFQQELQETESINQTLEENGTVGLENVVATVAVFEDRAVGSDANGAHDTSEPTLEEQRQALESRSAEEVEGLLGRVLDPDPDPEQEQEQELRGGDDPYAFLPTSYEPGSVESESRLVLLFHEGDDGTDGGPSGTDSGPSGTTDGTSDGETAPVVADAQLAIESVFEERFDDGFVFGEGITDAASASAVGDSFAIITPVAFVLVLFVLAVTYRDLVDVLIGFLGIGVVMAWIGGVQGWLAIPGDSMLIAVPFLLVGLSIDYSLHVVMRYREARGGGPAQSAAVAGNDAAVTTTETAVTAADGMRRGFAGVVLALAAATVSTGVGFFSNVVSPLPAIQNFAVLSASGILATFIAFGAFVPAVKTEIDEQLEKRFDRTRAKQPFGMDAGIVHGALERIVSLVRTAPVGVIVVAFLLASAGAYGATGLDTEFNQADFLPEDAPEWAKALPGPLAPDTYTVSDDLSYLGEHFADHGPDSQSQILIQGDVTDPETLTAVRSATATVGGGGEDGDGGGGVDGENSTDANTTIDVRADGTAAIDGPQTLIASLSAENETVASELEQRDATGNGLPDEDVDGFYDILFDADEEAAASVLYRTDDGEYESARLLLSVRSDAASQSVASDTKTVAAAISSSAPVTATATGGVVTTAVVQDALLETLVQAFTITVVVILVFLTLLYWVRHRAPSLGALTLAPVVVALAWLLGAMALLDVPFNTETVVMTSLAIGLGVDYSIHVSERFIDERTNGTPLSEAVRATITGTGGALLGSAATTAAGFGVLALSLSPPLRRFGLVTGLSIIFALVACLTVLPCLLVLRARLLEALERRDREEQHL